MPRFCALGVIARNAPAAFYIDVVFQVSIFWESALEKQITFSKKLKPSWIFPALTNKLN